LPLAKAIRRLKARGASSASFPARFRFWPLVFWASSVFFFSGAFFLEMVVVGSGFAICVGGRSKLRAVRYGRA
jgi:hypothetical protein